MTRQTVADFAKAISLSLLLLCAAVSGASSCPKVNTITNQMSIISFGAVGNGTTDDTAAIQCALNLGGVITFPAGMYLISGPLTVNSNTTLLGPGATLLSTVVVNGTNTLPTLEIYGTQNTPIAVGSPVTAGTTNIQVPNNFVSGDLLVLNNWPTSTDGSDQCTIVNNSCEYNNAQKAPLRQTRRREMLMVASATSTSVTFTTPTLFSYPSLNTYDSLTGYAFLSLVNPKTNVSLMGLSFTNVEVDAAYASNVSITGNVALSTTVLGRPCYNCSISFTTFNAQGTDSEVNMLEGSQQIEISGYFVNGACPSDCGIIKVDQAAGVTVNATFGQTENGLGGTEHAVMIDTNFAQDETGFTDVPDEGIVVNAMDTSAANLPDVFVTGDWVAAPPTNIVVNTSGGTPVYLNGASGVNVSSIGPASSLRIDGSNNVTVNLGNYSSLDMNPQQDTIGSTTTTVNNTNIAFNGTTFSETTGNFPFFNSVTGLNLANVTFNLTNANPTGQNFFPAANFNNATNVLLDYVKVLWTGTTQPEFWASGPVSNVAHFGGLAVPFPGVTTYGD